MQAGAIGSLTRIVAYLGGKRAMLFRNTTHLIGSVCFYAGADPLWVIAALDRGFEDYGMIYKGEGGKDPALDPGATLIVEFANGVRALVMASKGTPARGRARPAGHPRADRRRRPGDGLWHSAEEEGELQPAR